MLRLSRIVAFVLMLSVIFLSGCASNMVQMTKQNLAATKKIQVSDQIFVNDNIWFFGSSEELTKVFVTGEKGNSGSAKRDPKLAFKQFILDNEIYIRNMVRDEFIDQISQGNHFTIVEDDSYDATLILSVSLYGISQPHGFSSKYIPVVTTQGMMLNKQGEQIWNNSKYTFAAKYPAKSLTEFKEDPETLRTALETATQKSVRGLIETIFWME